MKRSILFILLGFVLLTAIAEGEDWVLITQNQDNKFQLLVDQDSIKHLPGNIIKALVRYEYVKPSSGKRIYDCRKCNQDKILSHTIISEEIDCNVRKLRSLDLTEHYIDSAPYMEQMDEAWKDASAGSIDEILINYLCIQKKNKE